MRIAVVGASSGLGRCIGVGLAQAGAQVALLARRQDRLTDAARDAGAGAVAVRCDVTDSESCATAVDDAARALGGLDGLVYAPAVAPLARLSDVTVAHWRAVFDTNVIGASTITAHALPHLERSGGAAVYLSSVSASVTPPWPGLGPYAVSKAALDKLVEAWRGEHPSVGFTRLVVGDCAGGDGDAATEFANEWDPEMATAFMTTWLARGYMNGSLLPVARLVEVVDRVLRSGAADSIPSIVVAPRG